jgi:hypothetical protein
MKGPIMLSHLLSFYLSNKTVKPNVVTTKPAIVAAQPAVYKPYVAPTYEVPLSSVVVPSQCSGKTYTHAFDARSTNGVIVNGTAGNDIIFVGNNSSAYGLAGDDCIVGGTNDGFYGGDGNDTIVSKGGGNYLDGGNGTDTGYYFYATDAINSIENAIAQ